jgi:hypothetical protein
VGQRPIAGRIGATVHQWVDVLKMETIAAGMLRRAAILAATLGAHLDKFAQGI